MPLHHLFWWWFCDTPFLKHFDTVWTADYLLLNCGARRAALRPYFFSSGTWFSLILRAFLRVQKKFNHFLNPSFYSFQIYLIPVISTKIKTFRHCCHPKFSHIQSMAFQHYRQFPYLQFTKICFEITGTIASGDFHNW